MATFPAQTVYSAGCTTIQSDLASVVQSCIWNKSLSAAYIGFANPGDQSVRLWSPGYAVQSYPYSVVSQSCPWPYALNGSVCTLDPVTESILDWLIANQSAIQNTLNNQSTLAAQTFDPTVAGEFFAWGFTGVFLVAIAAWGAGEVLGFLSRLLGGRN